MRLYGPCEQIGTVTKIRVKGKSNGRRRSRYKGVVCGRIVSNRQITILAKPEESAIIKSKKG